MDTITCPKCGTVNSVSVVKSKGYCKECRNILVIALEQVEKHEAIEPSQETNISLSRTIIYGVIGSLVGFVPVSLLKFVIAIKLSWLCTSIIDKNPEKLILTTCGLVYFVGVTEWSFLLYLGFIVLGGALFGVLGLYLWMKRTQYRTSIPSIGDEKRSLWWSFSAGLLFDIVFVFIVVYLGV